MRYHVVVYMVPDPQSTHEIPVVDEEFDSDRPVDEALIEWAADWHESEMEA
jgi:hypothetical protein